MPIGRALIGTRGTSGGSSVSTSSGTSTGGSGNHGIMVVSFDASTSISTVSDSYTNTWTLLGAVTTQGGAKVGVYYTLNWTGGAGHTGSMTFGGAAFPTLHMFEVTGAATSSPFDIDITETETAQPFSITSGTLSQAAELVIMIGEQNLSGANTDQYTSTALTILSSEPDLANYWTSGIATGIVASTSSAAYDITKGSPGSVAGLARLITIKEAGASGSPYTLAADQGSYSLGGQSAILKRGLRFTADQGAYAITGQDATLTYAPALPTSTAFEQGAYQSNAFQIFGGVLGGGGGGSPYTLTADQGAYSVTGQNAGLRRGYRLASNQGAYAYTGSDALADYAVTASQGSYSVSGQNATLRTARKLASNQGGYTLTGQSAGLKFGRVVAGAQGAYSLTGQNAGLRRGLRLVADQGNYSLTGQNATLTYTPAGADPTLTADQGSYTLTGQDAALRTARRLVADQGSYSVTGQNAGLGMGRKLPANQGAYALSGQDATLTYAPAVNRTLAAETGFYAIGGQDAALRYSAGSTGAPGFEMGGNDPKPRRRNLVYVLPDDQPRSSATPVKAAPAIDFATARQKAADIIKAAATEHAASKVSKAVRYGYVRTSLKPLSPALGDWNWINLYQRAYDAALTEQLRREVEILDQLEEDSAIAFLLLNL